MKGLADLVQRSHDDTLNLRFVEAMDEVKGTG